MSTQVLRCWENFIAALHEIIEAPEPDADSKLDSILGLLENIVADAIMPRATLKRLIQTRVCVLRCFDGAGGCAECLHVV
jgi:hypothetical protein